MRYISYATYSKAFFHGNHHWVFDSTDRDKMQSYSASHLDLIPIIYSITIQKNYVDPDQQKGKTRNSDVLITTAPSCSLHKLRINYAFYQIQVSLSNNYVKMFIFRVNDLYQSALCKKLGSR